MKIKRITSQYRNDFYAIMVCEHCGHEQKLGSGYDDAYYHQHVIPAQVCESCGKDRAGNVKAEVQP
jgi:hypothetical protein